MHFIDLKTQYERNKEAINGRIQKVLNHGKYIMGPEVGELEARLTEYVGVPCVTCSSGTDALVMALMAYDIGPGDAVFTTPFTFVATAEAISLVGATPVFVDIDTETFNLDVAKLKNTVQMAKAGEWPGAGCYNTKLNPKAIIPVDIFGLPADYDEINKLAREESLIVIEDAAQSFGAVYKGRKACGLADIGTTSFFPAKPLGCYGDGGAVFCRDDTILEKLKSIRVHGQGVDKYDNVRIGINGRLDTIQAAVLLEKLVVFDDELKARQVVAGRYQSALAGKFGFQEIPAEYTSSWAQFSITCDNRNECLKALNDAGIPTAVYYVKPLHLQSALAYLGYNNGQLPVAERISNKIFSLPMHPYLQDKELSYIIKGITKK